MIIDDRTKLVAKKITQYLRESGNRYQKTIIFCVDTENALRMRAALVPENEDLALQDDRYVMRITSHDKEGVNALDDFIDPERDYLVIVTTSPLLSTCVDAQTCGLIVLDHEVGSMTEFKQIIGRGTRIREDVGKFYFTLIDFRKADHFADPGFDGEPVQIYEPGDDEPIDPPEPQSSVGEEPTTYDEDESDGDDDGEPELILVDPVTGGEDDGDHQQKKKVYVDGVRVTVLAECVEYLDDDGKLVIKSLRDYSRKKRFKDFASFDDFLTQWKAADRKSAIVEELENNGLVYST
ncbi:MAG: hypothetical protein AAF585_08715 [Verrucomicrobiota bacterium]